MTSATHQRMHEEHTQWRSEDDFWRDEVTIWQREIDRSIEDVPRLEEALRNHAEALRKHAASIRLQEYDFAQHEKVLVDYEQGGSPQELMELARTHGREANKHTEQRKLHEEFKRQQHELMTKWRLLVKALLEAETRL